MSTPPALPGPCNLCGNRAGRRTADGWECATCGWRFGDAPDPDLPLPRIDVVYYIRFDRRVKIGTSRRPRQRLSSIRHEELLAFERGGRAVEQQRHRDFAAAREGGEWFTLTPELAAHIHRLQAAGEPWNLYARWLSDALQKGDEATG
ncbi:GIY-YIG nuclease family protein [Microbacterium sp. 179-I 3D4 NHS]|uniref:GIY-YIG nuclease family protein n=1 Tax=Microbacterium sp. 179-I 3D4 NHS TaxID=3142381 RepID=UPI0039A2358C